MSIQESTPGVYINELTGAGVIQGVGTSTAAFLGPTGAGIAGLPTRITNFDQFIRTFGSTGEAAPHLIQDGTLYNLSLAVQGFFQNGGTAAYVVRTDNSITGSLDLLNDDGDTVAIINALSPESAPAVAITLAAGSAFPVAFTSATIDDPGTETSPITGDTANDLLVDDSSGFIVGDRVITDGAAVAELTEISDNWVRPSVALAAAASLATAPIPAGSPTTAVRVTGSPHTLRVGSLVTISNDTPTEIDATVVSVDGEVVSVSTLDSEIDLDGTSPTLAAATYTTTTGSATVVSTDGTNATVDDATVFIVGDTVTDGTITATITMIAGDVVTTDVAVAGPTLTIADLTADRSRFRVDDQRGLAPGTVVTLTSGGTSADAVIAQVSTSGLITLAPDPARAATIAAGASMTVAEFALTVTEDEATEVFPGLSMNPTAGSYFLSGVDSELVSVAEPDPPFLAPILDRYPATLAATALSAGTVGSPANLGLADYDAGLAALERVDDVNMICAPDASTLPADIRQAIHGAMIDHCIGQADRIAIIDPPPGLAPSGPGSIEEIRQQVQSERGFATLYYPWLEILDPTRVPPLPPRRMAIPPSGHIAGVMARVDASRGVFKAPANVTISRVLGVERPITDREQAPLNRGGTNVLRVLPGDSQVTVWGARTTVDPAITDWMYVNVRRLLLFIEESIQESIRWAVFEPNDIGLWKSLERIINAFLRQQWRNGALFGVAEEDAFSVRIDEALNPPEIRNIGQLHIEILVAPVRPAEFIRIFIGLFDGGAQVTEG